MSSSTMFHPISPIVASGASDGTVSPFAHESPSPPPAMTDTLVEEQLLALLSLEQPYRVEVIPCRAGNAMAGISASTRLPYDEWRRKICEWSYKVVDHFRIDREVVGIALNFFDRFLVVRHKTDGGASSCHCPSCQRAVDSSTFQLGAMTALYLAIKLHAETAEYLPHLEEKPRRQRLRLHSFVELSRGQFHAKDICAMEQTMLASLSWKVNPPTPMIFVAYLLTLMPKKSCIPVHCRYHYDLALHVIHELSRYLTELSVCLAQISTVALPSEVAFASILVSMDMLTVAALPIQIRDEFCEAVATMSDCLQGDYTVRYLMGRLRNCFSPDMLMDDCDIDKHHPISVARESGLLDMARLYPSAPLFKHGRKASSTTVILQDQDMEESSICVTP